MKNLPDTLLMSAFNAGDDKAFGVLMDRYKERLLCHINKHVRDETLALDIYQEAIIKIINAIRAGKYTHEGKCLAWLYTICYHGCVDHFRALERSPIIREIDTGYGFDISEYFVDPTENAEEVIVNKETGDELKLLLNCLDETQKEVVVLHAFGGLPFREIAILTNCSINTALGRMRYALQRLRKAAKALEAV